MASLSLLLLASVIMVRFFLTSGAVSSKSLEVQHQEMFTNITEPKFVFSNEEEEEMCIPLPYLSAAVQLFKCNETLQVRQYFDVNSYYTVDLSVYEVISMCENMCK